MWRAKQPSLKPMTGHLANSSCLIAISELCIPHEGCEYGISTASLGSTVFTREDIVKLFGVGCRCHRGWSFRPSSQRYIQPTG